MHDNFICLFIVICICFFFSGWRSAESRIFSSPFLLQELFFPMEEFVCLLLNLTIPFKLYFADDREAIEVLKNYIGDDKKGMPYSGIIIYNNSKIDNNNNCKINNSNNIDIIMILDKDVGFFCLRFANSRKQNEKE